MTFKLSLSAQTLAYIKDTHSAGFSLQAAKGFSLAELASLCEKEAQTFDEKLKSLLLLDLLAELQDREDRSESKEQEKPSSSLILALTGLGFAGLVNYCIWGFDGVMSIMELFTSSTFILYLSGTFFSLISGLIFISFEFTQGAKELGVDYFEFSTVVNEYIEQEKLLKKLLRSIDFELLASNKLEPAEEHLLLLFIQSQFNRLCAHKERLLNRKDSNKAWFIEALASALCGLLYFFDGYFCGQSGAMFILGAGSISAGMATPAGALLMVGLGLISAIGALAFYCLVQQRSVGYMVSAIMGINKEKIEEFCKPKRTAVITKELAFREQLVSCYHATTHQKKEAPLSPAINEQTKWSTGQTQQMTFFEVRKNSKEEERVTSSPQRRFSF